MVDALHGAGGEAGVEDLELEQVRGLGEAREGFGSWCGGTFGDIGGNGAEAYGVDMNDLAGLDGADVGLGPVLAGDGAGLMLPYSKSVVITSGK